MGLIFLIIIACLAVIYAAVFIVIYTTNRLPAKQVAKKSLWALVSPIIFALIAFACMANIDWPAPSGSMPVPSLYEGANG